MTQICITMIARFGLDLSSIIYGLAIEPVPFSETQLVLYFNY
jgi:hypothetical protein